MFFNWYFIFSGGIESIIKPGLNSSSDAIKENVLVLIGSSSQSNPKVQIAMVEAEVLRSILNIMQFNQKVTSIFNYY